MWQVLYSLQRWWFVRVGQRPGTLGNRQTRHFRVCQRRKDLDQPGYGKANVALPLATENLGTGNVHLSYLLRPSRRLQILSSRYRADATRRLRNVGSPRSCQAETGAENIGRFDGRQSPARQQVNQPPPSGIGPARRAGPRRPGATQPNRRSSY